MTFTPEQKKIAQNLCKDAATLKFLEDVFCPTHDEVSALIEKNFVALPDAEYGQLKKVDHLRRIAAHAGLQAIKTAGRVNEGNAGAIAPK